MPKVEITSKVSLELTTRIDTEGEACARGALDVRHSPLFQKS